MKTKTFYIGLTFIIISFIACVLSFYLLVFGLPTFLIGAILIFLSKRTIKTKLLTTLIPFVLYIPFKRTRYELVVSAATEKDIKYFKQKIFNYATKSMGQGEYRALQRKRDKGLS